MTEILVYDGLRCIGYVVERDARRCEAYGASGKAIGVFPSHLKAARAVYEVAVAHEREVAA